MRTNRKLDRISAFVKNVWQLAAILVIGLGWSACAGRTYYHPTKTTINEYKADRIQCWQEARDKACTYSDKSACSSVPTRQNLEDECMQKMGYVIKGSRPITERNDMKLPDHVAPSDN